MLTYYILLIIVLGLSVRVTKPAIPKAICKNQNLKEAEKNQTDILKGKKLLKKKLKPDEKSLRVLPRTSEYLGIKVIFVPLNQ